MYIHEALKKMNGSACIYRKVWMKGPTIMRTINRGHITGALFQYSHDVPQDVVLPWHPTYDDLCADDWMVFIKTSKPPFLTRVFHLPHKQRGHNGSGD